MRKNKHSTENRKDAPLLNTRLRQAVDVFGNTNEPERWSSFEDFKLSVNSYYKVASIFFDGDAGVTFKYAGALLAFHKALDEFCSYSEKNNIENLKLILESPQFHEVRKKARDFLAVV